MGAKPPAVPAVPPARGGGWDWEKVAALCRGITEVLACADVASASRRILLSCRALLPAPVTSVALLPEDDAGPLIAWIDRRGRARVARGPAAPSAAALRRAIARVGPGYLENRPPRQDAGLVLPPGIAGPVGNVLTVPMTLGGSAAGLLCLADRPGGFSAHDLLLATAFGSLAAAAHDKCSAAETLGSQVAGATRDLTRANAALREKVVAHERLERSLAAERRFRAAVEDALPVGILVGDGRGCIVHVNRAFRDMTGWRERDLLGCRAPFPFWAPEEARAIARVYRGFLAQDGPREFQLRFRRRDGQRFDALVLARRIPGTRGAEVGWVASVADVTRQRETEAALRESEARLRRLSGELIAVEERERARISRDLHDSLGQTLSALKYRLEEAAAACAGCSGSRSVRGKLDLASRILSGAIGEVRHIVSDLRPSLLDDLGLKSAVAWFCREFRATHPGVRLDVSLRVGRGEVPEPLKITVFRLVQESLTNAARHSGADRVRVGLARRGEAIELTVRDNGRGLPPGGPAGGAGIIGMRERTALSGGTFSVGPAPGGGTLVRARWPLPPAGRRRPPAGYPFRAA